MASRFMRLLALVAGVAMIALVGGVTGGTATAAPPAPGAGQNVVNVTGTGPDGQQVFTGTFTAKSAKADKSAPSGIALVGDLTGQLTDQPGQPQGQGRGTKDVNRQNVAMPVANINVPNGGEGVAAQQAVCDVLNLTLGPLDLNLLGLMVHLDQVNLDITADPAGGLLGQLLCSLAGGLPSPPNPLQPIIDLLNQILGILGG
jgi:hypothetical protein